MYKEPEERKRISWEWPRLIIISPMDMKSRDLNNAWLRRWKNDNVKKPKEKDIPIKPKWLKVERAISFLRSFSNTVFKPAYKEVNKLKDKRTIQHK